MATTRQCRLLCSMLVVTGAALMAALPLAAAAPASAAPGSGTLLWTRVYDPTGNADAFFGCAKGPSGGLYVAGVRGPTGVATGDLLVCKYARSGSRRWARQWVSPWFSSSHGTDVAVDSKGNIVVAGEVNNPPGTDWVVTRWAPDGTLLWGVEFDGPSGGSDELIDLVIDRFGNAYACGYVANLGGGTAMMTVKFRHTDGAVAWQSMYVGPGAQNGAASIAIDAARNTYMAGWSQGTFGDSDGVIVKTDAAGNRLKVRRQDTGAHVDNGWSELELRDGVLYAAGDTGAWPATDVVVGSYTTTTMRRWVRTWDDPNHHDDWLDGIAVDAAGDLFACGTIDNGGAPNQSGFLAKWNARGSRRWFRSYKNGARYARYSEVVADSAGNAWVIGVVDTAAGHDDGLLARYAADGTRRWLRKWDFGTGGSDALWANLLSGSTSLYAVGSANVPPGSGAGLILKYRR